MLNFTKFVAPSFYAEYARGYIEEFQKDNYNAKIDILLNELKTVPYYHDMDMKTISSLPILTKEKIRDNFERLKNKKYRTSRFILDSTSGSTGSTTKFYKDKKTT